MITRTTDATDDRLAHEDAERALTGAVLADAIEWHFQIIDHCGQCEAIGTICAAHDSEHGAPIRRYGQLAEDVESGEVLPYFGSSGPDELKAALVAAQAHRQGRTGIADAALLAAYSELAACRADRVPD